jgi:hypothetical protein
MAEADYNASASAISCAVYWTCSGTLLPVEAFGSFTVLAVFKNQLNSPSAE